MVLYAQKYSVFLVAKFISSFGNWFVELALPFVILELTGSALAVALSFMLQTLPLLVLAPFIAEAVDNYSRKKLLIWCDILAAGVLGLCLVTNCSNLYVLYFACMTLGVLSNIYDITVNSYVPDIRGEMELKMANNLDTLMGNIALIVGPIIAGLCLKYKGKIFSFNVDMISFLLSALLLTLLTADIREGAGEKTNKETQEDLQERKEKKNVFRARQVALDTMNILKKRKALQQLLVICIAFSSCGAIFMSLDPVYVAEIFGGAPEVYGYINSAWGVGMILGSAMLFLCTKISDTWMFLLGIVLMGIATLGYGLSSTVVICSVFNFMGGLANTIYVVYYRTLFQKKTTSSERGKIFTLQKVLSKVVAVMVVALAGYTADCLSVRHVIVATGILTFLLGAYGGCTLEGEKKG